MLSVNKCALFCSTALAAYVALAGNSHSQDAESEARTLQTVTVTAQKRAQSSQDVGIAVAAVTGESIRERGIDSGQDLEKIVPNVSIQNVNAGGLPVVIVRGIGLQNFRVNDSPTTSFYVDEIYQSSIVSAEFSLFDLERVEILKGPQGGLYGRNTIAGAVQVISQRPEFGEYSGYASIDYGSFEESNIETGINIPIAENVAARVSGRIQKSGDQYTQSIPGGFDQGGLDKFAARVQLRAEPTDNFRVNFKFHGGRDESETPLLRTVGLYQDIGTVPGVPGASLGLVGALTGGGGGLCASILAGTGSDPDTCATLTGVTPTGYGLRGSSDGRHDSANDGFNSNLDVDWYGLSAVAALDIGDFVLTSVSGYDEINYFRPIDSDGTPVEFQHIEYGSEIEAWQQEFRLAYEGSDRYNWIIGLNFSEDELVEDTLLLGAEGVLPLFFGGATSSPQNYTQKTEAFAAYFHGQYSLSDTVRATGELRYTDAEKSFQGGQVFAFPNGTTAPFFSVDDSTSFENVSGKIGFDWRPIEELLLYANISRGFKTGGFFGGFATNPGQLAPFDEETIVAYEAGFKSDLLNRRLRLNASAFYYDRSDVQQTASAPPDANGITINRLQNIGDVRAFGAEVDVTYAATDFLTLYGGLGLTDSEVTDSDFTVSASLPLLGSSAIEGTNTPNYSKVSFNALADYERPVSENLLGFAQLDYSYRSGRDLSLITNAAVEDPIFHEDGYHLTNIRVGVGDQDGGWRASLFVENLFDEEFRVEARQDGLFGVRELYGRPRIVGGKLEVSWGR